ncbi:polyprenyl synthetase family protein [bacterium]|nr:polyprenyl synthetase family protein [bacterium]
MNKEPKQLTYQKILQPIEKPLQNVEDILLKKLTTDIHLLTEVSQYILSAGGKRFRPALLLLAAGSMGRIDHKACVTAAVVEYIHTATLLHDDVVDNADFRRSKKAARSIWGNEASVLVGDYLFTISFQLLSEFEDPKLIAELSHATTLMAKGEIIQLERENDNTTEEEYLKIIHYKTASLIGTATKLGGMIAEASTDQQNALYDCGINIGMAFQMIDDALDYDIKNANTGKDKGTDLKERKITLPLSHLLKNASEKDKNSVTEILNMDVITDDHVKEVCHLMGRYNSINYVLERARTFSEKAKSNIASFPDTDYKSGICNLADFVISRKK